MVGTTVVGSELGFTVGSLMIDCNGLLEGELVGTFNGDSDGLIEGFFEGLSDGSELGSIEIDKLGDSVGVDDIFVGDIDGLLDGD